MDVEAEYCTRIASMSVVERVRRAEGLFVRSRDCSARSILATRGSMPNDDLRWELALRLSRIQGCGAVMALQ